MTCCAWCAQHLRNYRADAWMSVGIALGSVVRDNTACMMAHALGLHMVDVSGNTFFEGPPSVPQVGSGLARTRHCLPPLHLHLRLHHMWVAALTGPPLLLVRTRQRTLMSGRADTSLLLPAHIA